MKTKINKKTHEDKTPIHLQRIQNFINHYDLDKEESIEAINLLDTYLPRGYSEEIVRRAHENNLIVTQQVARLVKLGRTKNALLFSLLIGYAAENRACEQNVNGKIKAQLSKRIE